MFNISDNLISHKCSNYNTYMKARQYYFSKRVESLEFNREYNLFTAVVHGSKKYNVEVEFDMLHRISEVYCTCPAYNSYLGYCKHIGAVLFEIERKDGRGDFNYNRDEDFTERLLDYFRYKEGEPKKSINLEVTYDFSPRGGRIDSNSSRLSFSIGENRLYKLKNIKKFIESIENSEELYFGKQFTFKPSIHVFKDEDMPLINLIKNLYESENYMNDTPYGRNRKSFFSIDKVSLTDEGVKRFFNIMKGRSINAVIVGREYHNVEILEGRIPIDIKLSKEKDDLFLSFDLINDSLPLVGDGEYFFDRGSIYRIPAKQREHFLPFYGKLIDQRENKIRVPQKYTERFVSEVYPHLEDIGEVSTDKSFEESIYQPELKSEIYFDTSQMGIKADVKFIYGDIMVTPFSKKDENQDKNGRILVRDMDMENQIISIFEKHEFKVKNDGVHLDDEKGIFEFIYLGIGQLQKISEIYYSEDFKVMKVKDASSFSGGVRLNTDKNLLEFDFHVEGIDNSELRDVFNSLKEKRKYYRLKDGSFLPLDIPEINEIQELFQYMDISSKDLIKDVIEIPKFRALFIDDHIKEAGHHYIKRELKFKELVQNIKEPGDIDYTVPNSLKNVLRGYQKFGFKWLKTLSAYGFGGILADDMGLGKTVQVLSFLLSEKNEKGNKPSLIVAPTSLVYNWAAEVEKFTPELKTLIIAGSKDEREDDVGKVEDYDIVITSYPLIRRDADLYDKTSFRYCIIDEAQHIKNPMSVGAKSVKSIVAENYFALTGTPIENSLTELWSIFDFVMPGYLLSHGKFKKKFEGPIVKDQDHKVLEELKKHIIPFILRRLKRDVLKELPDKIESRMVADMTKEQKKLYLAYLQQIKGEIDEEIKEKGFNRSHIKILAGLTRLRQICCDPAMFIEDYQGDSGKLSLLEEIIDDALDSNHRILLFSQFTSMLRIIREMLDKKNIHYKYLDGSTPSKERGVLVKDFNEGSGEIFLISLKAGGTGLNLTGADTVIHYDPWWNPAVEEQATDRAHRIGQKSSVQVMKLITKGTIEERIYELQERKRQMADAIIKPGQTLVSKLTEEEIKSLFHL